jgi:hypothetical protein
MGLVKEAKHIDLSMKSEPWTETELSDFRKLMQELKAKTNKRKVRTSVLTTKKKRLTAQ